MRKRILISLIAMMAFVVSAKAQLIYSGYIPTFLEVEDCHEPEVFGDADEAWNYLMEYMEIHSTDPDQCETLYDVGCEVYEDESYAPSSCYVAYKRVFTVIDECEATLVLEQTILVYRNEVKDEYLDEHGQPRLPEQVWDAFTVEEALPNTTAAIDEYLFTEYGITYPDCWDGLTHTSSYIAAPTGSEDCGMRYMVRFEIQPNGCPQKLMFIQDFVLLPQDAPSYDGDELNEIVMDACGDVVPVPITNIEGFDSYGVHFDDYMFPDLFEITYGDSSQDNDDCTEDIVLRTYTIAYPCMEGTITLTQKIKQQHRLKVYGSLPSQYYDSELPPTYTVSELEDKLTIVNTCGLLDLDYSYEDWFIPDYEELAERHYYIYSTSCDKLVDSVVQYFFKINKHPEAFELISVSDCSAEGAKDGVAELSQPTYIFCPTCNDNEMKMFVVEWVNHSKGEHMYRSDPDNPETNIYLIDSLDAGNYTVSVYPNCQKFGFDRKPLYQAHFTVKEMETHLLLQPNAILYSYHSYLQLIGMHVVTHDAGGHAAGTLINSPTYPLLDGFQYYFEADDGEILNRYQWWEEMYNPYMEGNGFYERCLSLANNVDLAIGKDVHMGAAYFAYKGEKMVKSVHRNLYEEKLFCSWDPNEIFGPGGYTDADSVCVQMINTKDDVGYTIMFENSPEFATSAAARVKVECPLSDKLDPTTFRLGQFSFNNMTFEVPEMASYYNQRLQLDSLGCWLDVTASIQVPENIAYWIFQTIDPATGVAPIDSLGFLPVNDTLSGCGEGSVTFTCGLANSGGRGIRTNEVLIEQAQIYFDENDVVPTNEYVNQFDGEAPVSTVVCDTTGAYYSHVLPIRFSSHDDEGGSGVHHINLYANLDNAGYELIGHVHPDSTFNYPTTVANMLEFYSQAVDNVGNTEPLKNFHELIYTQGTAPVGMSLSNNQFEENAEMAHVIGTFSTLDDQTSDDFVYALIPGEGATNNALFSIVGNQLVTNNDFRCYGTYEYSIRVRTTDLSGLSYEKAFTLFAHRTEEIAPVTIYESICQGEEYVLGSQHLTQTGYYEQHFTTDLRCDSLVCLQLTVNPSNPMKVVRDTICSNYDYEDNDFVISAETIAHMTENWSMSSDTLLFIDQYADNIYGCTDTTRLELVLHPAYNKIDEHLVCPVDLPYMYEQRPYLSDTTVVFTTTTANGCDSTVVFRLVLNPDSGTQTNELAMGWSWYSTYLDQYEGQYEEQYRKKGLSRLQNAFGGKGLIIKSRDHFISYSPVSGKWIGTLTTLSNSFGYMIKTSAPLTLDVSGCFVDPSTVDITLHNGWNWISFPSRYNMDVTTAFGSRPSNGDVLKSKNAFATYIESEHMWIGSLSMLEPGQGYMYNSTNSDNIILNYPSATRDTGVTIQLPEDYWLADEHKYADNITFIGLIQLDGKPIESDSLEVGAFCKGEERGSARAIYVGPLDAYRVFLTVQGQDGDSLNFRIFDHNRDKERRVRSRQMEVFHADNHYGTIDRPYPFNFNTDYDKLIEAEICEGEYYVANGFREYKEGTYYQERPNDSIIRLDLTVNPVYHVEKEIVALEFPMVFEGITFNEPGQYTLPFETADLCDSVLVVTVKPYDGVRELLISPVPADRGQRITLFFPFTAAEQHDLLVEVYTLTGNLMQTIKPTRYPIELQPFVAAGTYMVRITMGTGEVLTGKFVVK